jgi:RNA polymerase sigma-70 factor (ECF subfamily)
MTSTDIGNDDTLIEQAKAGDLNAFDCIYRRYLPTVYRRVRFVIPEQDIEDVTQEIFIAVIKSLPGFRGEALFSTWLRTLTNRKVAEYYRTRSRKRENMQVSLAEASPAQKAVPITSRKLEDRIALRKGLSQISERHREVILLRFAEGLKFDQIAETMGLSPEAAKSLFRRAISALRECLD